MRVAHVSDCYAPRTGGIETQVRSLVRAQAEHERWVITATPGHDAVRSGLDEVDGVDVERISMDLPFELPVHPRTAARVGDALDARRPDVVHVHVGAISPFAWGAVRAAMSRGIPVLATVHSVWGGLARPAYGLSDALVHWSRQGVQLSAVSDLAARRVQRAVRPRSRVLVLPNGIEPADWKVGAFAERPAGKLRLVSVMRMAARKRTLALLGIIATARAALAGQCEITATLVGDGPDRSRAERWARRHGLADAVVFAGRLDRPGILAAFAQADAYVQPSVRESFGIAALEARTAGLPVLVRAESGSVQFIRDGLEGLVATSDAGMAAAIATLARDPELCASIRRHNLAQPPAETWPRVVAAVDAAYAHAIELAARR